MAEVERSRIHVAPSERGVIAALGVTSILPERRGVDVGWMAGGRWYGVQRKEVKDLIMSVNDGRLAKDVAKMRGQVVLPTVVIEGKVHFTDEGKLVWNSWGQEWTREQWDHMILSLMHEGVQIVHTLSAGGTARWIVSYYAWTGKARHGSMRTRPGPVGNLWGRVGNRDYGIHLLQGLPGIGHDTAAHIYDYFQGVPWQWRPDITEEELLKIEGIGPQRAALLMGVFRDGET